MNASAMAGMAIAQTSTSIPHGLCYPLTLELGIPHGKAVGYFAAGFLSAADEREREYILEKAGFLSLDDFQDFFVRLYGKPEVNAELLDDAVSKLFANRQKLSAVPFTTDRDTLEKIAFYTSDH